MFGWHNLPIVRKSCSIFHEAIISEFPENMRNHHFSADGSHLNSACLPHAFVVSSLEVKTRIYVNLSLFVRAFIEKLLDRQFQFPFCWEYRRTLSSYVTLPDESIIDKNFENSFKYFLVRGNERWQEAVFNIVIEMRFVSWHQKIIVFMANHKRNLNPTLTAA